MEKRQYFLDKLRTCASVPELVEGAKGLLAELERGGADKDAADRLKLESALENYFNNGLDGATDTAEERMDKVEGSFVKLVERIGDHEAGDCTSQE